MKISEQKSVRLLLGIFSDQSQFLLSVWLYPSSSSSIFFCFSSDTCSLFCSYRICEHIIPLLQKRCHTIFHAINVRIANEQCVIQDRTSLPKSRSFHCWVFPFFIRFLRWSCQFLLFDRLRLSLLLAGIINGNVAVFSFTQFQLQDFHLHCDAGGSTIELHGHHCKQDQAGCHN